MDRRDFIRIMVAGAGSVSIGGFLAGCDHSEPEGLEGWTASANAEDIRFRVLSCALLAPNPHNKQPWIVDLTGPRRFDLYVDPERLLPDTDPPYRQIHISQGTFLEHLRLAAAHFGHRATIDYFPRGMYGNTVLEHKPVATVELAERVAATSDTLFDQIPRRQSNRRVFLDRPLSTQQIEALRAVLPDDDPDFHLTVTTDAKQRGELVRFATEAMRIEVRDKQRIAESVAMFRFNDTELSVHRDGFGVPQMGAAGIRKYLIEQFFISRESFLADDSRFGEQSIEGSRQQAESAAAFGWLVSKNNSRLDQVLAGHLYDRIDLTAAGQGVAIHPMSQVLQEYSDMASLQQQFKRYIGVSESHTVQMFFRLGIAEPVRHTARRVVSDLVMR